MREGPGRTHLCCFLTLNAPATVSRPMTEAVTPHARTHTHVTGSRRRERLSPLQCHIDMSEMAGSGRAGVTKTTRDGGSEGGSEGGRGDARRVGVGVAGVRTVRVQRLVGDASWEAEIAAKTIADVIR